LKETTRGFIFTRLFANIQIVEIVTLATIRQKCLILHIVPNGGDDDDDNNNKLLPNYLSLAIL
jgi:hypothetical protein